jgi:predicted ArsR family transcriptional regulator
MKGVAVVEERIRKGRGRPIYFWKSALRGRKLIALGGATPVDDR